MPRGSLPSEIHEPEKPAETADAAILATAFSGLTVSYHVPEGDR
jgi:hypothetical protein